MKTLLASAIRIPIHEMHRGNNGNSQVTVMARVKSKKRLAELISKSRMGIEPTKFNINQTYRELTHFGCSEAHDCHSRNVKKDDTLYYRPDGCRAGYVDRWFEFGQPICEKCFRHPASEECSVK